MELGIPLRRRSWCWPPRGIKRQHKRIDYLAAEFRTLLDRYPDLPAWLVVAGDWESQTDEVIAETTHIAG